jgi:hypothetical protein
MTAKKNGHVDAETDQFSEAHSSFVSGTYAEKPPLVRTTGVLLLKAK